MYGYKLVNYGSSFDLIYLFLEIYWATSLQPNTPYSSYVCESDSNMDIIHVNNAGSHVKIEGIQEDMFEYTDNVIYIYLKKK